MAFPNFSLSADKRDWVRHEESRFDIPSLALPCCSNISACSPHILEGIWESLFHRIRIACRQYVFFELRTFTREIGVGAKKEWDFCVFFRSEWHEKRYSAWNERLYHRYEPSLSINGQRIEREQMKWRGEFVILSVPRSCLATVRAAGIRTARFTPPMAVHFFRSMNPLTTSYCRAFFRAFCPTCFLNFEHRLWRSVPPPYRSALHDNNVYCIL